MSAERRASTRFKMNVRAKMYDVSSNDLLSVVKIINVSAGGVRLGTNKFFKPKMNFLLQFFFNTEVPALSIPARIIWSKVKNGKRFSGACFTFTK